MSVVRYQKSQLPPLTDTEKAELRVLAHRPDSEIDHSDLPPLDEAFWQQTVSYQDMECSQKNATTQIPVTTRMDADVLAWLESQGQGWHRRMNAILRDAMLHAQPKI